MIQYFLDNNKGYKWSENKIIKIKGSFFDSNDIFYSEDKALQCLGELRTVNGFISFIKSINGVFTILIELEGKLIISTDTTRVFPVFYSIINGSLIVCDSVHFLLSKIENKELNELASHEFLTSGFVLGNKTLIKGVNQIISDEYIVFENNEMIERGFRFSYSASINDMFPVDNYKSIFNKTASVFEKVFSRLLDTLEEKQVVLPLSGGYDSRLIAVMLKKYGIDNVICYTYGKENNFELKNSEEVAKKLGYKWIFIKYDGILFSNFIKSKEFDEYKDYSGKYSSMPFLQEYFAVKYLKDNKMIPSNSVIVSGYSGDFIGGSHIHKNYSNKVEYNGLSELFIAKVNIYNKTLFHYHDMLLESIHIYLKEYSKSKLIPYTIFEDIEIKERQSKFIFNASSIYSFFGYEHVFPFWDMDLLNHFKKVPYKYKKGKKLYDDVLTNSFFAPFDVNFEEEIQSSSFDLIKLKLKNKLKPFLPFSFRLKLLDNYDWINYKEMTDQMVTELKVNNIEFKEDLSGYNSRIIQWYLFKCKQSIEKIKNEII